MFFKHNRPTTKTSEQHENATRTHKTAATSHSTLKADVSAFFKSYRQLVVNFSKHFDTQQVRAHADKRQANERSTFGSSK